MFSLLSVVPVMSEAELREALVRHKKLYYDDPQVYMPNYDEMERCLHWMAYDTNGQFPNYDIAKAILDKNETTIAHIKFTFGRMRASAELYVQLWHHDWNIPVMSTDSLESSLKSIWTYRFHEELNLGLLFWPENDPPPFLGSK